MIELRWLKANSQGRPQDTSSVLHKIGIKLDRSTSIKKKRMEQKEVIM